MAVDVNPEAWLGPLVEENGNPKDVRAFGGYLGASPSPAHSRLYRTLNLTEYLEIKQEDIVHRVQVSEADGDGDLTRSVIWVKSGAQMQHVTTRAMPAQADFLQGSIAGGAGSCRCGCHGAVANPCTPAPAPGPTGGVPGSPPGWWGDPTSRYPC